MSRPQWWIPEAQQFESALDNALRFEEADGAHAGGEPESEHPGEAEISGACLQSLHHSVTQHVVTPLISAEPKSPEAQKALEQFPGVVGELIVLLQKTSRLAYLRGHVRQELTSRVFTAEASLTHVQRLDSDRTVAGSLDESGQEGSIMVRLVAARKTVKQKEWELADARRRIQQVEEERVRQDKRLRDLELALESSNMARQDAERRCADSTEEGTALQRSELRRRILETERALDEARLELGVAERRADGARVQESARVPQDLMAEVPASARRDTFPEEAVDRFDAEILRSQRAARCRKSMPSQRPDLDAGCADGARHTGPAEGHQDPLAAVSSPPRRETLSEEANDKFDVESLRSQRTVRSRHSMPSQRGAVTSTDGSPEQAGQALSRSRRRTMGHASAPALPPSSAEPAAQPAASPPMAPRGTHAQHASLPAGQAAMPGDLRSLGALLAGGGLFSARK